MKIRRQNTEFRKQQTIQYFLNRLLIFYAGFLMLNTESLIPAGRQAEYCLLIYAIT